jgi:hypothetical protein
MAVKPFAILGATNVLIDRTHRGWIGWTIFLFVLSTGYYVYYHLSSLNPPSGSTWPGLGFGIASTVLIVFCAAFGIRRKYPTVRIGRAETWLKAHIWLGLLSYPLAYYHAGFQFGGALTWVLMLLFSAVIVSGIIGLIAHHVIPRMMTERVGMETVYEQIDRILEHLVEEGDRTVAGVSGGELFPEPVPVAAAAGEAGAAAAPAPKEKKRGKPVPALEGSADLKAFYLETVRPFLKGAPGGPLASSAERSATFEQVRIQLPPPLHRTVLHIEEICEERRQLLYQKRLHHYLHGWLFVHLPLTIALIVLLVVHGIMALAY